MARVHAMLRLVFLERLARRLEGLERLVQISFRHTRSIASKKAKRRSLNRKTSARLFLTQTRIISSRNQLLCRRRQSRLSCTIVSSQSKEQLKSSKLKSKIFAARATCF